MDQGIIQEVVRPLMSGKEAQIYLVVSGGELRVAKVYKEAQNRTFRQRVEYTEGRRGRNTRTQRAKNRRSRFGRAQDEASWRSAEVDIIYRLRAAGVRVPEPHSFLDGVLVMELITDANGDPAPRLTDVVLSRKEVGRVFTALLSSVVKMLNAGVVHGDLSEFNVLVGNDGPVIIDFPQSVDPAYNPNARKLLIRDVDNLSQYLMRAVPRQRQLPYGQELWDLYERNELTPDTRLTGRYRPPQRKVDDTEVLYEIGAAERDAQKRGDAEGQGKRRRRRRRKPAPQSAPASSPASSPATAGSRKPRTARGAAKPARTKAARPRRGTAKAAPTARAKAAPTTGAGKGNGPDQQTKQPPPPARRRRRRRRRRRASPAEIKND